MSKRKKWKAILELKTVSAITYTDTLAADAITSIISNFCLAGQFCHVTSGYANK